MNLKEIFKKGNQMGISINSMKKTEAIRTIQKAENNSECYASIWAENCPEKKCLWRTDCKRSQKNKALLN